MALDEPQTPVDPQTLKLRFLGLSFDPHRLIYSTIILMTTLAIYDEGTDPFSRGPLFELIGVAIAPLFALAMAHAFSDALDMQIKSGHRLTRSERWHLLWENLEYLYIAIPPIILTIVLAIFGWDANAVVFVVQILGFISLFLWGVFAAKVARQSGWTQFRFGVGYALMGMIVIVIEQLITH